MTYRSLAEAGTKALAQAGIENAAGDAVLLLRTLLGYSATKYLLEREKTADAETEERFFSLIRKRAARVPLQYLTGQAEFLGIPFSVDEGVLIPRPETEELAQLCIDRVSKNGYRIVFDLCAGSGCIGISIALHCPQTEVWLVEKYDGAVRHLYRNIPADAAERIRVLQADIFTCETASLPLPDLIVSNPPYIASAEIAVLQAEVQKEPLTALDGGEDGLAFYRCIACRWAPMLNPGGLVALECGETQTEEIANLLCAYKTERLRDMYGAYRFVIAESESTEESPC